MSPERQEHTFNIIFRVLGGVLVFKEKEEARQWFYKLRQLFLDYNGSTWKSVEFYDVEKKIEAMIQERVSGWLKDAERLTGGQG